MRYSRSSAQITDLDDTLYPLSLGLHLACRKNIEGELGLAESQLTCIELYKSVRNHTDLKLELCFNGQITCCIISKWKKTKSQRCASICTRSMEQQWLVSKYLYDCSIIYIAVQLSFLLFLICWISIHFLTTGARIQVWRRRIPCLCSWKIAIWDSETWPFVEGSDSLNATKEDSKWITEQRIKLETQDFLENLPKRPQVFVCVYI